MIYYSGFADEAAKDLDGQIRATKELGWHCIEARNVDGENLTNISDAKFDRVCEKLDQAGVRVNCFGSAVANWSRYVTSDEDVRTSLEEMRRAVPRMKRLGTEMIRGMSFAMPDKGEPDSPDIEQRVVQRLKELVAICEDNGLVYVHENCMCYGGLSSEHALRLLELIDSPAFKLVYDTGNPVFSWDFGESRPPTHKQDAWQFYKAVREHIYYVHVKDGIYVREREGQRFPETNYTYPGEGHAQVERILTDLIRSGYSGGISIEPHMSVVIHEQDSEEPLEERRYQNYVEYGRRLMSIMEQIQNG